MPKKLVSFKTPSRQLDEALRVVARFVSEQTDVMTSLQDRAMDMIAKPASAAADTKKFMETVVEKFSWLKAEYLAVKELTTKCKQSGEDCTRALEFEKHMQDAHVAHSTMKIAVSNGVRPDGAKVFFENYIIMMQALQACSRLAGTRW